MEEQKCPACSRKLVLKNVSLYCTSCRRWFCLNDPRVAVGLIIDRRKPFKQFALFNSGE